MTTEELQQGLIALHGATVPMAEAIERMRRGFIQLEKASSKWRRAYTTTAARIIIVTMDDGVTRAVRRRA